MLGAGGAARAIACTLLDQTPPSELILLDVDAAVRNALAADLTTSAAPTTLTVDTSSEPVILAACERAEVIINCTPIGMHPHKERSLVPASALRPEQVLFDIVYNPLRTRLLQDGENTGCTTIPGSEMFVNQAALQFERFTGAEAPLAVMRTVVLERLQA